MIRRSAPLKRSPLKRGTKPLRRTAVKAKPKKNPMPPGRREEVFERDGWRCRCCGRAVTIWSGNAHHIKFRSHGVDHSMENLITLCAHPTSLIGDGLMRIPCHDQVHLKGNPKHWLWIVGNADSAQFVSENPRRRP